MKILIKLSFFLVLSSLFLSSCTEDIKARYSDEVMNVHDEIMPLTMKIPPLKEDLEAIKITQPDMATPIDEAIENLDEAYDAMYQWMDNAGQVQSELFALEGKAATERLEKEKKIILYIQEFTNDAMSQAKALKEKLAN